MTNIGDLFLIYFEDQPSFFARIENISSDSKRDWYQVKLLILQNPLTEALWILREEYINGEQFTMHGHRIRIERVPEPQGCEPKNLPSGNDLKKGKAHANNKVISIFDRKTC